MPVSVSLESRSSRSETPRKLTGGTVVTISAPQRRRPLASLATKESTTGFIQQKAASPRRPKNSRLSDRWPVLNRIIRVSKTTRTQPPPDDKDSSSDSDEEDAVCTHIGEMHMITSYPQYSLRIVHLTSPKFPSPLSGVRPVYRQSVVRHRYPNRGHSYSAFCHRRELWRKRKSEWDDYEHMLWQSGITLEEAYGGMAEDECGRSHPLPPYLAGGPWAKGVPAEPQEMREPAGATPTIVNPATFPRLGDLCSLRDSFLISVDTWFSDFPLWTLSKLVWIYDVNYRSCSGSVAHQQGQGCLSTSFLEGFDTNNSSADTLLSSYTDGSDTTLVNANVESPLKKPSKTVALTSGTAKEVISGTPLAPLSPVSSVPTVDHVRPWETCWFSRWETLYHQVSLAADIAAASSEASDPSTNGSREATRIILTTPAVLYDPHAAEEKCGKSIIETGKSIPNLGAMDIQSARHRQVVPAEDEEDDYGEVISISESRYRLGAHVNPLSMFATAVSSDTDADTDSSSVDCEREHSPDIGPVSDSRPGYDVDFDIVRRLDQLALCC